MMHHGWRAAMLMAVIFDSPACAGVGKERSCLPALRRTCSPAVRSHARPIGRWLTAGQALRAPGESAQQDRKRKGEQPVAQTDEGCGDLGSQEEREGGAAAGEAGEEPGKGAEQA